MYRDSGDSGALHSLIFQHLYANALYSMLIWVWTLWRCAFWLKAPKKRIPWSWSSLVSNRTLLYVVNMLSEVRSQCGHRWCQKIVHVRSKCGHKCPNCQDCPTVRDKVQTHRSVGSEVWSICGHLWRLRRSLTSNKSKGEISFCWMRPSTITLPSLQYYCMPPQISVLGAWALRQLRT